MLGPLRVVDRGKVVALGGPRQRTVLALLLASANKVVSTDRLIDDLYDGEPPDAARKSVQSYIANLRRALNQDAEVLRGQAPGYLLEVKSERVDALEFEGLVHRAKALLPKDPAASRNLLTRALALWYGTPLGDIADDTPALRQEAIRLEELRTTALEDRIDAELALGRHQVLVAELRSLTAEHPFRERMWSQLMLALYRSDRQAEALRTFRQAARVLGEELGIEPSSELRALEERILLQDPDLLLPPTGTADDVEVPQGRIVRGYELRQKIGEGTIGAVYRAFHPSMGREVAVKVVQPDVADDADFIRHFETGVGMAASLEHAHGLPIYDYWREPRGAYIVMRWMAGGNLADRASVLSEPQIRAALLQVSAALAAVHRRGAVHGAVKAQNILFDAEGDCYLADLYISNRPGTSPTAIEDVMSLARTFLDLGFADVDARLAAVLVAAAEGRYDSIASLDVAVRDRETASPAGVMHVSNPYKGLRPFAEPDAEDFFGREETVDALLQRLSRPGTAGGFVAVVGPSGIGKSSVVRAGLLPALRAGSVAGSQNWFITEMLPGTDPMRELEAALLRIAVDPPVNLVEQLASGPDGLARAVADVLPHRDAVLLLVVDQLEELFTLTAEEAARRSFIDGLVSAVTAGAGQIRVVVTLRADYFDRPLRYPEFGELVSRNVETIMPLSPTGIDRAIVGPAERVGVTVDPELQAHLVADVTDRPGSLPLLQYVLTELFEQRRGATLTLDSYEALGGIRSAIGRRAEEVFLSLDGAARAAARQMFLRLTALDEGTGDTRRRILRSELTGMEGLRGPVRRAMEAFGSHRLLTFDRDPVTRSPTVEVAHEALLREWPRLGDWIDEARADVVRERRLAAATREWVEAGRDPGYLLTGVRLAELETWTSRSKISLTRAERDFLAAGVARRQETERDEQRRRDHEQALERRSRFRLRVLVAVLAVAAVAGAWLTLLANRQADRAEHNLAIATARELTAEATRLIAEDAELGLLLAVEAADIALAAGEELLPETIEALHGAVLASRLVTTVTGGPGGFSPSGTEFVTADPGAGLAGAQGGGVARIYSLAGEELMTLRGHEGHVYHAAYSPDGSMIITSSSDGTARLWDPVDGAELAVLAGHGAEVFSAAFSVDGVLAATAASDGIVRVWSVGDGSLVDTFAHDGAAVSVSFGEDGRLGVAADDAGAFVWDLDTRERTALTGHRSAVCGIAFVPGSPYLVTTGQDGAVLLRDASTARPRVELVKESAPVCGLGVSGIGSHVVAAGEGGTAYVIEIPSGRRALTVSGHASGVGWAAFDASGRYALTFGGDGFAKVWDVSPTGARETVSMATSSPASVAAFSPQGDRIVTTTEQGGVAVWTARSGRLLWETEGHENRINGASFSPDGAMIVTASEDRTAKLWDAATGTLLHTLEHHQDVVWSASFRHYGRHVITVGLDGLIVEWDTVTGDRLATIGPSMPGVFGIGTSPDEAYVAFAGVGVEVRRNDLETLELAFGGHDAAILDVDFSPDGRFLATSAADGLVRLWDLEQLRARTAEPHLSLAGHGAPVLDVDFSPDGSILATLSLDGTLKFWSIDGTELFTLRGQGPGMMSFDPTGTRLAVPNEDSTVRVLVVPSGELLDLARSRRTRTLTDSECVRYLHLASCSAAGDG